MRMKRSSAKSLRVYIGLDSTPMILSSHLYAWSRKGFSGRQNFSGDDALAGGEVILDRDLSPLSEATARGASPVEKAAVELKGAVRQEFDECSGRKKDHSSWPFGSSCGISTAWQCMWEE